MISWLIGFHNINKFNPLRPTGSCMYLAPTLKISKDAFCIYGFRMILTVNRNYFVKTALTCFSL
jgi:hypothetical protein